MAEQTASSDFHTHDVDPGARQIAGIYAKGFLAAAETAGEAEVALDELSAVARDVLEAYPKLREVLASGFVDTGDKVQILDRMLASRVRPVVLNFLKVLAKHDRLPFARDIAQVAREQFAEMRGQVRVEVSTAAPLDAAQSSKIKDQLRGMLGGEPVLVPRLDPGIIGGVVLRVGDTVYDGSVAAQLAQMRGQIIHRSVHEIQSRRDRFRHPAGN